ncbi:cation channel family protein (macronuclear) [Tetrahymena thermophila SB210]|uniref:Cation channel family protein n=1 Tax=Tetrahymena thermophila (strain SB210) TaxID=312017 RepID=Q22NC8_TETTS|nr:cation channel family protein [Tetrahymena thermophila SB210]EAR86857.2 cation channel family protein [Tetrahymena thermophila SB210]|eukprot:XP_001007102.2 cation channel family protein [Tetrahymena thermophila SB210]
MKEFDLKCSTCQQFNHGVLECPIINPKKDMNDRNTTYIIQNKGKDCIQLRKNHDRRKKKKYNSFKYESEVRYKLREIRLDITGILSQEIQKKENSDKYLDEHDIFENFNDFEFFVKCPIIKMIKSEYNEMIYELVVDEDDEEIDEDIPFLECIQEYLRQEQKSVQEQDSDFQNQASTFKVLHQQNTNEPSIAPEQNSVDINETNNQEFQPKETSIIENLIIQQQIVPQNTAKQSFAKKQKTGNVIKGLHSIYSMDLDNDVLREQNNQQNEQNPTIQTDAYFQGLEKKMNMSSFEQDILKLFKQQNQSNGSKLKIESKTQSQFTRKRSYDQEFPEYPDSPLRRQNKLKEGKSNATNTVIAASEINNNQNQGILMRTNKRRITKTVTINQIENQLLNQMSRQISTASNQPSQCSSEQNSELKNSIKVHHQKQSSTNYSDKTQNQQILSNNNINLNMKVALPSIQQEGKEIQPSSFKYIKPPSSNMIATHQKQRQSAIVGLDLLNNIHFLQSNGKEKNKVHSDEQVWSVLPDFETFKTYQRYFPLNNIEGVIMKYNRLQDKKYKKQNQRENQLTRGKTMSYLNRCFNNKQSPQQKRRGADKSLISNINQQINQISISALKEKKKKQKLEQDSLSQCNNKSRKQTYNSNFQYSSSRVDKESDYSIM